MPFFRRKQNTDAIGIKPADLNRMLEKGEPVLVLDVRQPDAMDTYRFTIPGCGADPAVGVAGSLPGIATRSDDRCVLHLTA